VLVAALKYERVCIEVKSERARQARERNGFARDFYKREKALHLTTSMGQNRGQNLNLPGILQDDEETSQAAGDGARED
jgi:hypothetical protein